MYIQHLTLNNHKSLYAIKLQPTNSIFSYSKMQSQPNSQTGDQTVFEMNILTYASLKVDVHFKNPSPSSEPTSSE